MARIVINIAGNAAYHYNGNIFPILGMKEYALSSPEGFHALSAFVTTYFFSILLSISITVFMNIVTLLFLSADGLNVIFTALVTKLEEAALFYGLVNMIFAFSDAMSSGFFRSSHENNKVSSCQ